MPRRNEPTVQSSGDESSASRRSHRHRHHTQPSQSTPRSAQTHDYYYSNGHFFDMSSQVNGHTHAQANGHGLPRRVPPNPVYVDFQIYDPQASAEAGYVLESGMLIRATSTAEFASVVAESSAIAYLYREGENTPVVNATVPATAVVVEPDLDVDVGVTEASVTVVYQWDHLIIRQPGTYCYRIFVTGRPGAEYALGLGTYDSANIQVTP